MAATGVMLQAVHGDIPASPIDTTRMTSEQWLRYRDSLEPTQLTARDWESHRETIKRVYLAEKNPLSLKKTQRYMYENHGIIPTERMYKTRFKDWNWPPKNLKQDEYNAMNTLYNHLSSRFASPLTLTVKMGSGEREHISAKTAKQLSRPSRGSKNGWRTLELSEALEILFSDRNLQPRVRSGDREIDLEELRNSDLSGYVNSSSTLPQDLDSPLASPSSDSTSPSQQLELGVPGSQARSPTSGAWMAARRYSSPLNLANDGRCGRCPESTSHIDYDLDTELERATSDTSLHGGTFSAIGGVGGEKALVASWSVPYVLQCFANDALSTTTCDQSLPADRLHNVITATKDNKFLLPCLNWTVCILWYNCRRSQLRDLVEASTDLIATRTDGSSVLKLPFQLVRAHLRKDDTEMQEIGEQFKYAYAQVRAAYGDGHPNTITYFFYWCWYAFWYQDAHNLVKEAHRLVKEDLQNILPRIRRLLGGHNSLSLNCMVMLGRCFMQLGQHHEAVLLLRDALHQMGQPTNHMRAYQLHILNILAAAEAGAGDVRTAERHLREVVDGRIKLFGLVIFNEDMEREVWEPIYDLEDLLSQLGRGEEAEKMKLDFWTQQENARNQWYLEGGQTPPEAVPYPVRARVQQF